LRRESGGGAGGGGEAVEVLGAVKLVVGDGDSGRNDEVVLPGAFPDGHGMGGLVLLVILFTSFPPSAGPSTPAGSVSSIRDGEDEDCGMGFDGDSIALPRLEGADSSGKTIMDGDGGRDVGRGGEVEGWSPGLEGCVSRVYLLPQQDSQTEYYATLAGVVRVWRAVVFVGRFCRNDVPNHVDV
jgi:hypothetical protein